MQAWHNNWILGTFDRELGQFPAQTNVWTRFVFDVTYSTDPSVGSIQVSADLNSDGDVDDSGERLPRELKETLLLETDGPNGGPDGLLPGDSVPSHLRVGIHHAFSVPCPAPGGCSIEVGNLQVLESPAGE